MDEALFISLITMMLLASTHNLIKSILIYRAHRLNLSSIIKITLNSNGIGYGISNIGVLLLMKDMTLSGCWLITYSHKITNFLFSGSITIFLVWKLSQYRQSSKNDYLAYGLLSIRSLFYVMYIVCLQPRIVYDNVIPECVNGVEHENILLYIATVTDLIIDACVAFWFIQYIRRNLQTEQHIPLSQKLIIWNALRISVASIQHLCTIAFGQQYQDVGYKIQIANYIVLSYLITYNVGKSDNLLSEACLESGNYKGKNSDEDITLRTSNGMKADTPLKNVHDEIKMERAYKIEKLEQDGEIGILKQSVSFYELASLCFGDKRQSV